MPEIIKLTINGREVEAEKGAVLLDVCKDNAENIPSFCYYKDLEPQASCRMCLVRIEKMPKLQTSCTIKVTDGMVVTTRSAEIEKAQRSMGEFLLTNHPLDCPVCDRGGECELQEVIFDWGDLEERFTEPKNVRPEKYLSPIVANVARRPEAARVLIGGRNLGGPADPAARFTLSIDGEPFQEWTAPPGFFLEVFDIPAGRLMGEGGIATVSIQSTPVSGSATIATAIEQFDLQAAEAEDLAPQAPEVRRPHLEPDDEQEHDDPELRDVEDGAGVGIPAETVGPMTSPPAR